MRTISALTYTLARASQAEAGLQKLFASSYFTSGISSNVTSTSSDSRPKLPSLPLLQKCSIKPSNSLVLHNVRFGGSDAGPAPSGNTIDNWASFRLAFNKEKPNNLGGSFYSSILVFGFAYMLNDMYYFPPRTLFLGAMVFTLLYVRRSTFDFYYGSTGK